MNSYRRTIIFTLIAFAISFSSKAQNGLTASTMSASDAAAIYANWKSNYTDSWNDNGVGYARVHWQSGPLWADCIPVGEGYKTTASEGMGYGMVLAAYNNDQDMLDRLLNFMELVINISNPSHGLMPWLVWGVDEPADQRYFGNPVCPGSNVDGSNPATDGDMDAAFAMIKAIDNGWVRASGDSYQQVAEHIIGILKQDYIQWCEVASAANNVGSLPQDDWLFAPGPFGACTGYDPGTTHGYKEKLHDISYYSPGYFRLFADFMDDSDWDEVAASTYRHIERVKLVRGGYLVPDFSSSDGKTGWMQNNYKYDASRTPWRIAMDYVWNGTAEAQYVFLDDINYNFLSGKDPGDIVDGYEVTAGNPEEGSWGAAAFYGGFACGLTAQVDNAYNQNKLDQYATHVKNTPTNAGYFNYTLTAIYSLLLAGEFDMPMINQQGSLAGKYRLKNGWEGLYLNGGGNTAGEDATSAPNEPTWGSQQWDLEHVSGNIYRLKTNWGGYYLANNANGTWGDATTEVLDNGSNSQLWEMENVLGNTYRVKSVNGGYYLNGSNTEWTTANLAPFDATWTSMEWELEPVSGGSRIGASVDAAVAIYPNPSTGHIKVSGNSRSMAVFNSQGAFVGEFDINQGNADLSSLTSGMYILKIGAENTRFVKE